MLTPDGKSFSPGEEIVQKCSHPSNFDAFDLMTKTNLNVFYWDFMQHMVEYQLINQSSLFAEHISGARQFMRLYIMEI